MKQIYVVTTVYSGDYLDDGQERIVHGYTDDVIHAENVIALLEKKPHNTDGNDYYPNRNIFWEAVEPLTEQY